MSGHPSTRRKARRGTDRRTHQWLLLFKCRRVLGERRQSERRCGYDRRPLRADARGPVTRWHNP